MPRGGWCPAGDTRSWHVDGAGLSVAANPSVTLGREAQPRPDQGKETSVRLHRARLNSPETAGCPGDGEGRAQQARQPRSQTTGLRRAPPHHVTLSPGLSFTVWEPGRSSSVQENPGSTASHPGAVERVSAAHAAEPDLVLLAWPPGLPPAEPSWARPSSPVLPRQDTPLPAVVHMCGHARRRGQAWLLPTALVPGHRREAAPPHRPPPQRGGPTGWEAQSPPGTRRRTGELTRDLPPPSIRWQSGGAAAPSPPASRSHSVPSAWQGRSAGVTRAAQ